MARRFVRIDLSNMARDFRPIAVEPGVPLLDYSNANARILYKWLGGMVAEPEWEGESVNFFVRDDHGGRLEDVVCQAASDEDIAGMLKDDMELLRDRLSKAKPETSTERGVHKIICETFKRLVDDPNRVDRDCYFFRYRDVQGRWRLIWCWGYQRVDQAPAPSVVCTDPECNLLFVRRPGQSYKCPACEAAIGPKVVRRAPSRRNVLAGVLLFLLGGLLVWWFLNLNRLTATPGTWSGPVGSRVEFQVSQSGFFGSSDVSQEAAAVVADPRVAYVDPYAPVVTARGPGKTVVHFYRAGRTTEATLTVAAASQPKKVFIEPGLVELGLGTTAHLKLIGEYEDGTTADLTDTAQWLPKNDGVVYACDGFLEGLAEGTSTVTAQYRATPKDKPLDASANVSVAKMDFTALELAVEPDPVPMGRASKLRIDAVAQSGKKYSVLESSRLALDVDPSHLATAYGTRLEGKHPGHGKLNAAFNNLTASLEFDVVRSAAVDRLVVSPEQLEMVVGEITDLTVLSPSSDPVHFSSSAPGIVQVGAKNRLIGRSEGDATVTVRQGAETRTCTVKVSKANVQWIAVKPARVVVPVDHATPVRVMARIDQDRDVELAPDLIACTKKPSPRYADFDARTLELHGIWPTEPSSPQTLGLRFQNLQASAPVEVIVAPLRLELTPPGPVDLPLGQMMPLEAWANYRGGYRVEVGADRVQWHSVPPSGSLPGLELRGDRVAAVKAGVGPLSVWGTYFKNDSNRVAFKSVAAAPVDLRLEVDRTLRLANEPGRLTLAGSGPRGDVELVPELAEINSSNPNVLRVDAKSGAFMAAAPGDVTVTATHAASKKPTELKLRVVDPAKARLVFEPASVKLAVDERTRLELFLEVLDGPQPERAALGGPGVAHTIAKPEAVRWRAPVLVGLNPSAPFPITATYYPYLARPATAQVEVTASEPAAIRIVPNEAPLAPGQTVAMRVDEQVAGNQQWREVRPDAVSWQVPAGLMWSPATEGLRPAATIAPDGSGSYDLVAEYRGKQATGRITVAQPALDPADKSVQLAVDREPEGLYVPIGTEQRYAIVLRKGAQQEPAADVLWPRDFENEYVRWRAPVLTAKQAGYQQWLRAEVGGRTVRFVAYTVDPSRPGQKPLPRGDQPVEVKILSDQGPAVRFPLGAEFDDFRVEARYADGMTRIVTKKALLSTPEGPQQGPLAFSGGRMRGLRAGRTTVEADFEGVPSEKGLAVEVTETVDIDQLRLRPAPVSIMPGETITMDAVGYKEGKSVGILSGLPGMTWRSNNESAVRTSGASVTGVQLGQANVTAQLGRITSEPAQVEVVDAVADALVADPEVLQLRVGEEVRLGTDLSVLRGPIDFSRQCEVTPALPGVVRFVPETRSLVGVSPGVSAVTFAVGDKLTSTTVQVGAGVPVRGDVVIEPASAVFSPGQALDLRVFVVSKEGLRVDRTSSAVLTSSSPQAVVIRENRACAVAPGQAEISAQLPEAASPGKAVLEVDNQPITELVVDPAQLKMSVGDLARLSIQGRSASGTRELYPQANLKVTAGGPNPQAIQIAGANSVDAVAPGTAEVAVSWADQLKGRVPVTVTNDPWSELTIDPPASTIHPGQGLVYQVTGLRGGRRQVVRPEDGLRLSVSEPQVAQVNERDVAVVGSTPGRTSVIAQLGPQRAEAALNVVPGEGPAATNVVAAGPGVAGPGGAVVGGPGGAVVGGPGGAVVGGPGGVAYPGYGVYGGGGGVVGAGGPAVVAAPGVAAPLATAAALKFIPDVLRIPTNSPGVPVQVVEVDAAGNVVQDVTKDPNLELTAPHEVATLEKTPDGPVFRPVRPGDTRVAAKLGTLVSDPELLIQVGDMPTDQCRLTVAPDPLDLWAGETGTFQAVTVDPGLGQLPVSVSYSITPAAGQNVVSVGPDGKLRGVSPGETTVVVTSVDPNGPYNGLSATATVRVNNAEELWIQPNDVSLRVGETSPQFAVMARGADGTPYQVPATMVSVDENTLAADPSVPGRFIARAVGGTQVRGIYRNREVLANVTVMGQRFVDVKTDLHASDQDFSVSAEIQAAASEGPLEYRVFAAGQTPPDTWVPAQDTTDGSRRVVLESPRIAYGPRSAQYSLIFEARSPTNGTVERYPFTFQLAPSIQRTDRPSGPAVPPGVPPAVPSFPPAAPALPPSDVTFPPAAPTVPAPPLQQ